MFSLSQRVQFSFLHWFDLAIDNTQKFQEILYVVCTFRNSTNCVKEPRETDKVTATSMLTSANTEVQISDARRMTSASRQF